MKRRSLLISMFVAGLLAIPTSGTVLAGDGKPCPYHKDGERGHHHDLFSQLDLSKEQREKIDAIRNANRSKMQPLRERLRELRKKLRDVVHSDRFDAKLAQQLADEKGKLVAQMTMLKAESRHNMVKLLTPEQHEKLKKLKEERRQHREQGRHND